MWQDKNYWDEFEYDKLKLLYNHAKVQSVMDVLNLEKTYDNLFPISVELHLTDSCNLRCPWCTDRLLHEHHATLEKEVVFDLLTQFGKYGTGVTLEGGGEPTIHKDFEEIVQYGWEHDVHMGLITNGTTDISHSINKLKWVRISLDASTREEYIQEKGVDCFEHVLNNLERYRNIRDVKSSYLGVGYVITNRNYSAIESMVLKLNDLNVDYIYFRPVEEAPDITPARNELYDLRKKLLKVTENLRIKFTLTINDRLVKDNACLPCVAHSLTSIIHADGEVVCCEKRRHDNISLGNVKKDSFYDIWNSSYRKEITEKLLDPKCQEGCSVCRITPFNKIFTNLQKANTIRFI